MTMRKSAGGIVEARFIRFCLFLRAMSVKLADAEGNSDLHTNLSCKTPLEKKSLFIVEHPNLLDEFISTFPPSF